MTRSATKSLIIVESPAKIKTISKFLGGQYKIMSTMGHIKDLPEKEIGVDVSDQGIELKYVPLKGKKSVISDICKEALSCQEIFLASDPDREGEIISFHIGQEIAKTIKARGATIHRIVFNEITKPAILQAIDNKKKVDQKKVAAQQARRVLDRWVGYEVSPILWKKIAKGLSAGRVQSAVVLLVVNRENEIEKFVPVESWTIKALLKAKGGDLVASVYKFKDKVLKIATQEEAKQIVSALSGQEFSILQISEKDRAKNPLAPFMTSSLQQDAYNKLGFSVDRTMALAQQLYEGVPLGDASKPEALITYMRTDSLRLSDTAMQDIVGFVEKSFGKKYLSAKPINYAEKGGAAQDAHEAIRPISVAKTPDLVKSHLDPALFKLYELIWRRTVACQMASAIYACKQILVEAGDYQLKATGSVLTFDGFLKVYKPEEEEKEDEVVLSADVVQGEVLKLGKLDPKQHFTQPPPRYTEASLVKEMKDLGIGRPSTYAATLSIIQKRNYVEKKAKKFCPTELGRAVVDMLQKNMADIIDISFTAKMEEDLDKIASGDLVRDQVLLDFYKKFQVDLAAFGKNVGAEKKPVVTTDIQCPECKKNELVVRFGKAGEFAGCKGFPECKFTSQIVRDESGQIVLAERSKMVELEDKCPQCGKNLVERKGRYGPFAACPGFPACKYIKKDEASEPKIKARPTKSKK